MVALLATALVSLPSAAGSLVITGRVHNGTASAGLPAGLVVTASSIDGSPETVKGTVDERGDYRIEVSGAADRYLLAIDYLSVTYSAVVETSATSNPMSTDLTVFETTEDESSIRASSDTITVVIGVEDTLEILQLFTIQNAADRTFVGTSLGSVLRLPFPPGAFGLSAGEGIGSDDLRTVAEGFTTNDPLLPGETSFSYLYKVRVRGGGWPMRRAVFYPTKHADVLIEEGLTIAGTRIEFQEEVTLGGRTYRRYRSDPLSAGSSLDADFGFAGSQSGTGALAAAAIAVGGLVLLGIPMLIWRRRQPPVSRDWLVDEIAALDDEFESGAIDEKTYRRNRAAMKDKLVKLTETLP